MQQSWHEQTETRRHDMTHLKPLQQLSGRVRTQESQSPSKQSYLYSDQIWKENLASRSFSSSQVHREISIACGVAEDTCCCSCQRHNVLGREKEGRYDDRVETSLFSTGEWTPLLFSMGADCCHIWKSDSLFCYLMGKSSPFSVKSRLWSQLSCSTLVWKYWSVLRRMDKGINSCNMGCRKLPTR